MYPYWLLFLMTAAGVATHRPDADARKAYGMLVLGAILIALMVGLRFEVGADWETYAFIFRGVGVWPFHRVIGSSEPGFQLLNWLVNTNGGDLWLVNLICGSIFAYGLVRFARRQPDPWLVLAVATPYLITVVAMGYTRQSVAIGLLLAGLADAGRSGRTLRFAAYVAIAALFHRTAVFMFPIVALASPRNRLVNLLVAVSAGYTLFDLFLSDSLELYVRNYVDTGYSSQGAAIRIALTMLAAAVFIAAGRRLGFAPAEYKLWRNFALVTFGLAVALAVSPSSTAVDRLALYVIPLQLAVLGRAPMLFFDWRMGRAAVVIFSATVLFVWLTFATHAQYWLPYRFYPI